MARRWGLTLGGSALGHALALALLLGVGVGQAPEARAGDARLLAALADAGAGGGGGPTVVHLAWGSLPTRAIPEVASPTEVPVLPTPPAPEIEVPVPDVALTLEVERPPAPLSPSGLVAAAGGGGRSDAGTGGGAGGGVGPGTGSDRGPGTGSGTGTGGGDGIRPPAPLSILVPPAATPAVRGKSARVLLQVDSAGAVRAADVVVSSGDRRYDEQLRRVALGWRFRPARDAANRAVAYPFEVSLRF